MSVRGPRVALLGKQGAGKGTQASRIAEHYDVPHLSTGDLLRAAAAAETELGLEAKEYMDRGGVVPDDLVLRRVEGQLDQDDLRTRRFVLDGVRRHRGVGE